MHIADDSSYTSINAWSRTLTQSTFQACELLLNYLRWLDQSYGATVTCALGSDRSSKITIHGVEQLSLNLQSGRIGVQWLKPEPSYWPVLQGGASAPSDVTQTHGGTRWQFYVDNKRDNYLLRDLTSHIHG
ncbi:MAG: hypothetical protein WCI67_10925 [Chloroflexales bacterium]